MMDQRARVEMEAMGNRAKLKEQLRKQMEDKLKEDQMARIKAEVSKKNNIYINSK